MFALNKRKVAWFAKLLVSFERCVLFWMWRRIVLARELSMKQLSLSLYSKSFICCHEFTPLFFFGAGYVLVLSSYEWSCSGLKISGQFMLFSFFHCFAGALVCWFSCRNLDDVCDIYYEVSFFVYY